MEQFEETLLKLGLEVGMVEAEVGVEVEEIPFAL